MSVLHELTESLGKSSWLDKPAKALAAVTEATVRRQPLFDLLNGSWLGHPVHPLMITGPLGAWMSAALLDLLGGDGNERAADTLVAAGVVTAVPTAATGMAQWADTYGSARRIGAAHAMANTVALGLQGASWAARARGNRRLGLQLSWGALAAVSVGGYLGGHLSYSEGVGVDSTAFVDGPGKWTSTGLASDDVAEGSLQVAEAGGVRLLVTRASGQLRAYDDRCTHAGGPLHEGEVVDGCIECPWHGSRFHLADGTVARTPATVPQPRYSVRVVDGVIEVRAA